MVVVIPERATLGGAAEAGQLLGFGTGQHRPADFPRIETEARNELFGDAFAGVVGPGDQHDVVDETGKEAGARIAVQINRGDDHHVEVFRLVECLFDILVT